MISELIYCVWGACVLLKSFLLAINGLGLLVVTRGTFDWKLGSPYTRRKGMVH